MLYVKVSPAIDTSSVGGLYKKTPAFVRMINYSLPPVLPFHKQHSLTTRWAIEAQSISLSKTARQPA